MLLRIMTQNMDETMNIGSNLCQVNDMKRGEGT